jgi:hypothetical protein
VTARSCTRIIAIFGIFIFITSQFPVCAIAQAGTAAEVADIAAVGAVIGKKQKNEPLITDSLWGNLVLDMAYQRDAEIKKLVKRLNLVNLGTMGTIAAVAGGTLAQGIIALSVINPPPPQHDSYLPLGIGAGMSGLTLVAFAGRAALNHCLMTRMRNRQLVIKHKVETILAQFESSHGENAEAETELTGLIGKRAANEWAQLWRSSNMLASTKQPNISQMPTQDFQKAAGCDPPLQQELCDRAIANVR